MQPIAYRRNNSFLVFRSSDNPIDLFTCKSGVSIGRRLFRPIGFPLLQVFIGNRVVGVRILLLRFSVYGVLATDQQPFRFRKP